jgi:signal transduction histidine kinase/CheY-like chemotaxis protein
MDTQSHIHWSQKLEFKLVITFLLGLILFFSLAGSIIYNEATAYLEKHELDEITITNHLIVEDLLNKTTNASALAYSIANTASMLPLDEESFKSTINHLLALAPKQQLIAGGGVWPEPYAFNPNKVRNSFFWGKDRTGNLQFFENYNLEQGNGYHNEAWYVPSTFQRKGDKFWSGSYVDPHSQEPMVTVSVPIYKQDTFFGVSTVDINLSGLDHILQNTWSKLFSGYSFIVDMDGKLISKIEGLDTSFNYPNLSDLAEQYPSFSHIITTANAVTKASLLPLAQGKVNKQLQANIANNSYQITTEQAELIAAVIEQPPQPDYYELQHKVIKVDSAPLLDEPSFIIVTEIPDTYWKIVNVLPESHLLNNVKKSLTELFLPLILVTILLIIGFYIVMHVVYIRKVTDITEQLISTDLTKTDSQILTQDKGELGLITRLINEHVFRLRTLTTQLTESKQALELRVRVSQSLQHPIELKYLLEDVLETICTTPSLNLKHKAAIVFLTPSGTLSEVFAKYGDFDTSELSDFTFPVINDVTLVDDTYLIPLTLDNKENGVILLFSYQEFSSDKNQYTLDTLTYIGNMINLAIANEIARLDLINEKAKAEHANRAKSDFLASMSHELRTPLNSILGFSQLLKRNTQEKLSEQQNQQLDFIIEGGKYLLKLINQVLELSAIEAGKIKLDIQDVSLLDSVHRTVDLASSLVSKNQITLSIDTQEDIAIHADKTKLDQVFINLLSNAIKYNRPQGEVHIKWRKLNDDFVQIAISDTGIGISEDKYDAVFDPFNRLGKETSNIEGTGIGLSVTKQLIELMGGTVYFESVVAEGTTFYINIPIAQNKLNLAISQKENATLNLEQADSTANDKRVLYVEDIPTNKALMKSFFKQWNQDIELEIADSAEEARQMLDKKAYQLILMDLHLPNENGIHFTESLKTDNKFKGLPIIAVTARAIREDIKEVEHLFDAYITKPVNFIELSDVLEEKLKVNL